MKISDAIDILKSERLLERTPSGRPLTEYAVDCVKATIEDEKNWDSEVIRCLNCCIIVSGLLIPDGCPNCGGKDITLNI